MEKRIELFFLCNMVLVSMKTLMSSFFRADVGFCNRLSMAHDDELQPPLAKCHELRREDLGLILSRIGLGGGDGDHNLEGRPEMRAIEPEDVRDVFAEEEPSLAEVKAAFGVFDEGGDGFIDEFELQRVLAKLGIAEGFDLDSCRRMIEVHDRNRDGRIDFSEFVKFMEISLCSYINSSSSSSSLNVV